MKDEETGLEIYGIPNAETLAAMKEADEITRNHRARFRSAEELFTSIEGPIVVKDEETGLLYAEMTSTESGPRISPVRNRTGFLHKANYRSLELLEVFLSNRLGCAVPWDALPVLLLWLARQESNLR